MPFICPEQMYFYRVRSYYQVQNYEYRKHDAGNSIRSHECHIHFAKVIGFNQEMLINKQTCKHRNTYPVQHAKLAQEPGDDYEQGRKNVKYIGNP
jgi:hypothetical protein